MRQLEKGELIMGNDILNLAFSDDGKNRIHTRRCVRISLDIVKAGGDGLLV